MRRIVLSAALAVSCLSAPALAQQKDGAQHHAGVHKQTATLSKADEAALAAAIAQPARKDDSARDKWRHPAETLSFFAVRPDMKVGEYAPGGGWYSRLLGYYLGGKGQLAGLFFNPGAGPFDEKSQAGIRDGAKKYPAEVSGYTGLPASHFSAMTLDAIPDGEAGTFDRILVIRMMHNLMRWNIAESELKAMRSLLKNDGMIGIVQHRARPDAPYAYADGSKGYLREADVIKFVEANGFELVGKSEVNANPADTANWAEGVWELPPTLKSKREDLRSIGESDRMTLLFRKRP